MLTFILHSLKSQIYLDGGDAEIQQLMFWNKSVYFVYLTFNIPPANKADITAASIEAVKSKHTNANRNIEQLYILLL